MFTHDVDPCWCVGPWEDQPPEDRPAQGLPREHTAGTRGCHSIGGRLAAQRAASDAAFGRWLTSGDPRDRIGRGTAVAPLYHSATCGWDGRSDSCSTPAACAAIAPDPTVSPTIERAMDGDR